MLTRRLSRSGPSRPAAAGRNVLVLATVLVAAPASGQVQIPSPPEGRWATTAVAVLQHSDERCSGIAERLTTYWKGLSGGSEQRREALDRYVLTQTTADLAGARKALDIVRGFLPTATAETSAGTGAVLERLYDAETALCNLVAQPPWPFADFEERLEEVQADIDFAESELGSRIALPLKNDLRRELKPYVGIIDATAGLAQRKMFEDLETLKTEPEPPTELELMQVWSARYQQAALPTKTALAQYLEGRRASDARAIQRACKDLLARVIAFLADEEIFKAPDPDVELPLKNAYRTIRTLGGHCTAGRFQEVDKDYRRIQKHLGDVTEVLAEYSLRP